jgi:hypothetical protein
VTFNTISSSTSNFKTVVATAGGSAVAVNVIVYELTGALTPEDDFTGRSAEKYGLRERVTLGFQTSPSVAASSIGGLRWSVGSSQGTVTNETGNTGIGQYEAPFSATTANLEVSIVDGPSKDVKRSYSRTVVAPSGGSVARNITQPLIHCNGKSSSGFYGYIYLHPKDVSFARIYFTEGGGVISAQGFYLPDNGGEHEPWGVGFLPNACNSSTGCVAYSVDVIYTGQWSPPFSAGTLSWPIQWQYAETESVSSPVNFTTALHEASAESSGAATISKQGSGNYSRVVSDPTSGNGCTLGR